MATPSAKPTAPAAAPFDVPPGTGAHITPEMLLALASAQALAGVAAKDAVNPHFKSSYADLASVQEVFKKFFCPEGFSVVQPIEEVGEVVYQTTILLHSSGGWVKEVFPLWGATTPQQWGSLRTYARRYGWAAVTGIVPGDDDDANGAMGCEAANGASRPAPAPARDPRRNPTPRPAPAPDPRHAPPF